MKKLIYSTCVAIIATAFFIGCKDPNSGGGGGGGGTVTPAPKISFQTNTGTQSGYTFTDGKAQVLTSIKLGVIITSPDVKLKSTKMTVKYSNQLEQIIGTDSIFSGTVKNCTRDYIFLIPKDKGTYTFTAYATDNDATTTTAKIVITAYGPLGDRGDDTIYSLQAVGVGKFSAFDLAAGEAITASSTAGNEAFRDIVDMSTNSTLGMSWKSQNGTQYVKSVISGGVDKIGGKTYTQFASEQDIIDGFDAGVKVTTVTGLDLGTMLIAKVTRASQPRYILISIIDVSDVNGAEDDYYIFQSKE